MPTAEQDLRLTILNTLLTTPHRQLAKIWPIHSDMTLKDPRFYVRLAAWYSDHGDVRDHKEMFIVNLILSDFPGHRDTGLAMLRALPPYQLVRVVDFIHGRKETVKVRVEEPAVKRPRRQRKAKDAAPPARTETLVDEIGLFRNPPRALKTEVTRYLREREADADWFDSSVLVARKALKRLYALLHIKPGPRAQLILFDETPPPDSRVFALKALAKATNPEDQAAAIRKHQIPYRVAATVVQTMTPAVLSALVERMSPQEVINNLEALRRRGALDDADIKSQIEAKLDQAKTGTRVSALKAEEAMKAAGVSKEVRRKLEQVADTQIKAKGRITRPTALLIDKSGSMEVAIELGKRIGAMLSAVCSDRLHVFAFDTMAYPIQPAGAELADWEKALRGITAGGGTSAGVAVEYLRRKRQVVEQLIVVTDEDENTAPFFVDSLRKYRQELHADPVVCFVRTPGGTTKLEEACRTAGIQADAFQFNGDYYSLPNLVPMLARPSRMELLMEVMEYPLPERRP
ncbi:MAG: VWA domain-containing protein [Gemmataceae bacterium]|nr:VWA domain-containing protein [Gemmataceae bacterium]